MQDLIADMLHSYSVNIFYNDKLNNAGSQTLKGSLTVITRSVGDTVLTIGGTRDDQTISRGELKLSSANANGYTCTIYNSTGSSQGLTQDTALYIPNKTGILAVTSDIDSQYAVYEFSGWFLRCARVGKVVVWVFDGTTTASLPAWVYCQLPWTINASVLNSKTDTISIAEGDDKIKITRNVSSGESIRAYGIFSIR